MKINWKVRFQNKPFLVAFFAVALILVQQVTEIFGINIANYNEQATELFNTILAILVLLGVIVDPTTKGHGDSKQALGYQQPRDDLEEGEYFD